jgi:dTDP-glucose 4,6-dehydratase
VQISTDEVYGSREKGFFKETDRLDPSSPYSASKASADLLSMAYFTTYKLPVVITRSSNNFGPYQFPEKIIPLFITNILTGKEVPVYGNGLNVRDWLYVMDNCKGIDLVMHRGKKGEIYNIGANNEKTNIELTKLIIKKMGKSTDVIEYVKDRLGHDKRYAINCLKIRKLGFKLDYKFDLGIKNTIKWYKSNKSWWFPLIKK